MTRVADRLRPDFLGALVEQRARIRRKWVPVFVAMALVICVETACVVGQWAEIDRLRQRQLGDEDLARLRATKDAVEGMAKF